jgi:hypothetical protein
VGRLLSLDRLAPELKASRAAAIMTGGAAALVFGAALFGLVQSLHLEKASPGTSQVLFHSTEPFGTAPGARLVYVPERRTLVIRGWLLAPLRGSGVYQVWAVRPGGYTSLGMADAVDFVGFTLVAEQGLEGVQRIVITQEPPGGSVGEPRGPTLIEMVEGL